LRPDRPTESSGTGPAIRRSSWAASRRDRATVVSVPLGVAARQESGSAGAPQPSSP
jgi:hypothetical protein